VAAKRNRSNCADQGAGREDEIGDQKKHETVDPVQRRKMSVHGQQCPVRRIVSRSCAAKERRQEETGAVLWLLRPRPLSSANKELISTIEIA
jgi:hypothetical protein